MVICCLISLSPVEVFQQVLFLERLQLDEVRRRGRRAIGDIHGWKLPWCSGTGCWFAAAAEPQKGLGAKMWSNRRRVFSRQLDHSCANRRTSNETRVGGGFCPYTEGGQGFNFCCQSSNENNRYLVKKQSSWHYECTTFHKHGNKHRTEGLAFGRFAYGLGFKDYVGQCSDQGNCLNRQQQCALCSCLKALYSDSKIKENVEDADLQAWWVLCEFGGNGSPNWFWAETIFSCCSIHVDRETLQTLMQQIKHIRIRELLTPVTSSDPSVWIPCKSLFLP